MYLNEQTRKKIIPIASGKGGVGKSVIASNLALTFSIYRKKTILVDLDLGGSNLHTYLGLKNRSLGIGNLISDKSFSIEDIVIKTKYPDLHFIPGDVVVTGTANINHRQITKLFSQIIKLDADYIIIDLGSGSSSLVTDLFLISNSGLIVTSCQAPSVLNAFSLIKSTVFNFLKLRSKNNKAVHAYLTEILKEKTPGALPKINTILKNIRKIDKDLGINLRKDLQLLKLKLVANMGTAPDNLDIIQSLVDLVKKDLGIGIELIGMIFFDTEVNNSVLRLEPLIFTEEDSIAVRQLHRIAQKILQSEKYPVMPFDFSYYKDPVELAYIEAENDFLEINGAKHESGSSTQDLPEEVLSLLKKQKEEIDELKSTVRMLTLSGNEP
jgi:flagellar biosynthesis protein FlhG